MVNEKKAFLFILVVLIGGLFFTVPLSVKAVTVGPVKLEYSVDPGEVISEEVFILNEGERAGNFYPDFEKYIEVDGKKKFIADQCEIASWFEIPSVIALDSQEQKHIPFTLRIPQNAEPGGHFAVMWWGTAPPAREGEKQVSIVTRAGILVYLKVSGEIDEGGQLVDFSTAGQKRFFSQRPINFDIDFEATGNVHLVPQGEVRVKNIFGRTKAILEVNQAGSQVFPQDKKTFKAVWSAEEESQEAARFLNNLKKEWRGFALGIYRAEVSLEYGEEIVKEIQDKFTFIVIPWRTLLLIVLILIALGLGFIKGLKKYNRWVITKAQKKI